ncbi:MAG: DUF4164 domain-containing protein [Rhizobiaceae bacterium]
MSGDVTLKQAIGRLTKAVEALEKSADQRIEREQEFADSEEEVQRMGADRARLAQELDQSEARAERLQEANTEVSRRLVSAMETIRAVLDR